MDHCHLFPRAARGSRACAGAAAPGAALEETLTRRWWSGLRSPWPSPSPGCSLAPTAALGEQEEGVCTPLPRAGSGSGPCPRQFLWLAGVGAEAAEGRALGLHLRRWLSTHPFSQLPGAPALAELMEPAWLMHGGPVGRRCLPPLRPRTPRWARGLRDAQLKQEADSAFPAGRERGGRGATGSPSPGGGRGGTGRGGSAVSPRSRKSH